MYAFQLRESMDFAGKHLNGMMFFFTSFRISVYQNTFLKRLFNFYNNYFICLYLQIFVISPIVLLIPILKNFYNPII